MRRNHYKDLELAANQNIKERNFWLAELSGELTKTTFPYDYKRKDNNERSFAEIPFGFPEDVFVNLMKLSGGSLHTLHIILLTGLVVLLNKYTGNNDIIIGTPVYKQDIDTEFINKVVVLRNRFDGPRTFKELLLAGSQTLFAAMENYRYPLEILLEQLNMAVPAREDFPLFDIVILNENIHDKSHIQHINTNMNISFRKAGETIEGVIAYNVLLYDRKTIERIISHFVILLQRTLPGVDVKISDIDILSGEEKGLLLYEFNDTGGTYSRGKMLHQLFEEQVEKIPDKIALVFEDNRLTFKHLNEKANRLAWFLRTLGVGAGSIVGLLIDRSLEMITGILGILKAGGAYLPLDPESPGNRILGMLDDCRAPVLLTEAGIIEGYSFTRLQALGSDNIKPHVTGARPQIMDFDRLPIPDRSLVDYETYNKFIGQAMFKNCLSLQATRGCPYKCAYCHKIWPKNHVLRTAENLFAEVQLYYNMGVRRFALIDDIFNLDIKNSARFFELIIENGLDVMLAFPNGIRGDILTKDYIDLMVEAGTIIVAFALETASPRLQKLIKKDLNLEKFRENIEYFCKKYPQVILEIFTMHGFPTETEAEAAMTLDFIKRLKWLHFPFVFILIIFPNTDMAKLAIENGVPPEVISRSEDLFYHDLPDTLPFEKRFTLSYQADFFNNYFLSKERLLHVLPHQMKVLTEDEMVKEYNSYIPTAIRSFAELLKFLKISKEELRVKECLEEERMYVPHLNGKLKTHFANEKPREHALKILLLDLSLPFSRTQGLLDDLNEPPLGLIYLLTYLNRQFGAGVNGKIAKSRMDFDNYSELKVFLGEFAPDVIGIRTLSSFKNFFHQTVSMIRQWGIDIPVIAGGPYATSGFRTLLQDGNVDLVVLGEGEVTLYELIAEIMKNGKQLPGDEVLDGIRGIAFVPREKRLESKFNREIVTFNEIEERLAKEAVDTPGHINQPADLAYTIFTSGSTGRPKSVPVTHANISPLLHWGFKHLELSPSDRSVQNLSYYFDWSVWEIFITLASGTRLYMIPNDVLLDPGIYIDFIIKNSITVLHVTPSQFRYFVNDGRQLETLKYLFIGAEKLMYDLVRRSYETVKKECRIFNMYGPTEAAIIASVLEIERPANERLEKLTSIPIGRPVGNTALLILDGNLKLCPPTTAGQLYIAGDGVATGYLNRPELTAEKFISPSPLTLHPSPLYKTGDLARWLTDGSVEFLGRNDTQTKIRGYRIETEEIENHLSNHRDINEVVVLTVDPNGTGEKYLYAYFVSNKEVDTRELKDFLSGRLPGYMIPSFFAQVDKMPLNANGKIDRLRLISSEAKPAPGYTAPRDEIEERLAGIWSDVLGIEKGIIGIDTNFFDLGGHSLNAAVLINRIHKTFSADLELKEIFTAPTIRGLAKCLRGAVNDEFTSIAVYEEKEYYQLSPAQKRMFILQQMEPASINYNIPIIVVMEGDLQGAGIEETLRKMIKRHEGLRTSFMMVHHQPVQIIHDHVEFKINYYRVKGRGQGESPDDIIDSFIKAFDLSRAPLLRIGIIEMEEQEHILMVDMHHIITDGLSMEIFIDDFTELYAGRDLPGLRLRYRDYSQWRSAVEKESLQKQETYWLKMFEGEIPRLNLPIDYSRPAPAAQSARGNGDGIDFTIGSDETEQLNRMAREKKATVFMVLLAVYYVLLAKISGQDDIIVGTINAGRSHADLNDMIGLFVNAVALRNHLEVEMTFKEFLQQVKEGTLEAFKNKDYQFEDIVDKLQLKRDVGRNPLTGAGFTLQNREISREEISRLGIKPYKRANSTSKVDMAFNGIKTGSGLLFTVEYSTKLFKKETIEKFIKYFKEIVAAVIDNGDTMLKDIRISHALLIAQSNIPEIDFGI